ncbi:MAG: polyprenyl synthetase family protein [Desulfotignum sp.]|nr:polyprenyl synthetase family protein [Desulfotignum sp.]
MTDPVFDLAPFLRIHRQRVNACLEKILAAFDSQRELVQAMRHSLMAGGKRLRPVLAMASARACGGDVDRVLPAACALEMIHTYSLIHDDLPAMDDDDLRRGKPTCHKRFSEPTAILAGDALLTHAFYVLSHPHDLFDSVPESETLLALIALIASAAGVNGMVEGQMLDIQFEKQPRFFKETGGAVNQEALLAHLENMHGLKTGKMIVASVAAGAVSVNASQRLKTDLAAYATCLGLAFQVMDDILNVEGDPVKMGKAAGSDLERDKLTFPVILGLDRSKIYARQLMDQALDAIVGFDDSAEPLRAIARYVISRDR